VRQNLVCVGNSVRGDVALDGTVVQGDLMLQGGRTRLEAGGAVSLRAVQVAGRLPLFGPKIQGDLGLGGAYVARPLTTDTHGEAKVEVGGNLSLRSATLAGGVTFAALEVRRLLILSQATVSGQMLFVNREPTDGREPPLNRVGEDVLVTEARVTGLAA